MRDRCQTIRLVLIMMFAHGVFGCSAGPRSVRITEQNEKTFMDPTKGISGLTLDDRQLLYRYVLRSSIADSSDGAPPTLVGKTIGDLIAEEKTFETDARKRDAKPN